MTSDARPDTQPDPLDARLGPVATWRGITTVDPETGRASLSLNTAGGVILRARLSIDDLATIAEVCVSEIAAYAVRMKSHSGSSSGSPSRDVSMPRPGENV